MPFFFYPIITAARVKLADTLVLKLAIPVERGKLMEKERAMQANNSNNNNNVNVN